MTRAWLLGGLLALTVGCARPDPGDTPARASCRKTCNQTYATCRSACAEPTACVARCDATSNRCLDACAAAP